MRTYEDLYREYREHAPTDYGVCGPVAVAAVSGASFADAYDACTLAGRQFRQGTHLHAIKRALELCGARISETFLPLQPPRADRWGYQHQSRYTAVTIGRALPRGKHLAFTTNFRHVLAVIDGKVLDWTEGRRHRIDYVWTIEADASFGTAPASDNSEDNINLYGI